MPPDDAALVRRARSGDRAAFAQLVDRHAGLLRATTRRAAGGDELAADAAQEAVLTAMLSLDRLRDDAAFGPWLAGIGLNATRHLRRDRRAAAPLPAERPADSVDVDQVLDDERAAARIRRAIATLPEGQRDAVALFYLAGLTHAEAAEHLGVPAGAVKTRLHKARATLRRRLDPLWKEQYAMPDTLVPMHVADVRRAAGGARHVVLLESDDGTQRLPIWVGPPEAVAIAGLLERVELPRPGPYDFAAALLAAGGDAVREVRISRLAGAVFYADVVLEGGATIDARPSDAISLALTAGAPLLADAEVLARTRESEAMYASEIEEFERSTEDRRVLAAETRERLARQAEELRGR
jgi:RNA polymerase sigma-70 factor (ECF subfamily)